MLRKLGIATSLVLLAWAGPAAAVRIHLLPPEEGEYVRDLATMIDPGDEEALEELCAALLAEQAIPLIVVTIESMDEHCRVTLTIEAFARTLFDQWGIGHPEVNGVSWNKGILLLVSKGDRRARIELGADWARDYDAICQEIMDEQIIARFRNGDFSKGILKGAAALDKMARQEPLPMPPLPWWVPWAGVGGGALFLFTVVSLIRSGASGWAWLFWGALFAFIGYILYQSMQQRRSSFGGGFSGGSFGGGFSGGGGATGSW